MKRLVLAAAAALALAGPLTISAASAETPAYQARGGDRDGGRQFTNDRGGDQLRGGDRDLGRRFADDRGRDYGRGDYGRGGFGWNHHGRHGRHDCRDRHHDFRGDGRNFDHHRGDHRDFVPPHDR